MTDNLIWVTFTAEPAPRWHIETPVLQAGLEMAPSGLALHTLEERKTQRSWRFVPQPLTYLSFAGHPSPLGSWSLRDWHTLVVGEALCLAIDLTCATDNFTVAWTERIWVAADLTVLRRWGELRNEGSTPIIVDQFHLLDLTFEVDLADATLKLFWVDAFAGHRWDRWDPGDTNFACHVVELHPSDTLRLAVGAYQPCCSWLALVRNHEAGATIGLEYDGAAEVRVFDVARTAGGERWRSATGETSGVRLVAAPVGPINVPVEPGGSWQSPAAFIGLCAPDWDDAAQVSHALVEKHLAPPWPDEQFPYVMFNSWGFGWELRPEDVLRCLEIAAEIGVEVFVADFGWARAVGDWTAVARRMPPLDELARLVRHRGMLFGAWMGFANADPDAPVLREHPDWRAFPNDWGSFGSRALCLAEPAVRDWVVEEICRVVHTYQLDYLVHDFELITPCTNPTHHHPPDSAGYHSATGLGEVLRRVRKRCPHLIIENCQGGGRIMTYAMVQTHDTSIISDGAVLADALARRQALFGATYPFPLRFCDNYMEERPTEYACHSSMIGGPWILMDRLTEWRADEIQTARRAISLYKMVRTLFRGGQVYHLRRPDGVNWDGVQIHQPATGRAALLLFQPPGSRASEAHATVHGLEEERTYQLRVGLDGPAWLASGADLRRKGVHRPLRPGQSEVILIEPLPDG